MDTGLEMEPRGREFTCDACIKSKITRKPLPTDSRTHTTNPGERGYSDVWGPARHATLHKQFYYVSLTNDYEWEP